MALGLFTCSTRSRSATHLPPQDISGHFRTFSTRNRGRCAREEIAALVEETGMAEVCGEFGVVLFLLPEVRILLFLV